MVYANIYTSISGPSLTTTSCVHLAGVSQGIVARVFIVMFRQVARVSDQFNSKNVSRQRFRVRDAMLPCACISLLLIFHST